MILQFIKRDPAWQYTPWCMATAAIAAGSSTLGSRGAVMAGLAVPPYLLLFMRSLPHRRVTFFEAALPVSARDLLLARFLSFLAMIWLPAFTAGVLLAFMGSAGYLLPLSAVAAMMTLMVVVVLFSRMNEFASPAWLTVGCPVAAVLILIPLLISGHAATALVFASTATLVAAPLLLRRAPSSFQQTSLRLAPDKGTKTSSAPPFAWWAIARSLWSWQIVAFFAVSLLWVATGDWCFGTMYVMLAYNQMNLSTRWTLSLPISRSARFAFATIPLLVLLSGATAVGMFVRSAPQNRNLVRQGDAEHVRASGTPDVIVSLAFWKRAQDGRIPIIEAPWGEQNQPPPLHLLGLTFYNPYAVGQRNSRRFEEWQFARATTEVYGRAIPPRDLAKNGSAYTPVTLRPRMQILTVAAIDAMALLWVWLLALLSWHRINRLSKVVRNALGFCAVMIPIGTVVGVDLFSSSGLGKISGPALQGFLLMVSRHLPENLAGIAVISFALPCSLYWLALRQSGRSEVSLKAQQNQSFFSSLGN